MPKEIKRITKFYQKKPKHLKVAQSQMTVPEITQYYFETKEKDKLENLTRLIDVYDVNLGLVFCNTKKRVDWVAKNLRNRGYAAEGIHGDMNQKSRDKVMNKFRNGNIEILIATDVERSGFGGKRTSDRESESSRLRRDEGFVVRSDDGQHRICLVCGKAAALPNAPSGQSPAPIRAEALSPLLATIGEKHEKRYQIQHADGIRRPGEDQGAGGEGPHVHE
jgi:Superfamily II DNA and RNA helicases